MGMPLQTNRIQALDPFDSPFEAQAFFKFEAQNQHEHMSAPLRVRRQRGSVQQHALVKVQLDAVLLLRLPASARPPAPAWLPLLARLALQVVLPALQRTRPQQGRVHAWLVPADGAGRRRGPGRAGRAAVGAEAGGGARVGGGLQRAGKAGREGCDL